MVLSLVPAMRLRQIRQQNAALIQFPKKLLHFAGSDCVTRGV